MAEISILNVFLHSELIGTLSLLPGDTTLFTFANSYIENNNRMILSLSFKDKMGGLITDIKPTRSKLPPFFSNLLPEGHLREYLAKQAGVKSSREFFLLWILGRDLPGALTIEPADRESWPAQSSDIENKSMHQNAFRFSLAGVQLKFSAVLESSGGLTIPAEGVGGSWIVKLPSTRFEGVPENEYSMMMLARHIGIDTPDIELISMQKISGLPANIETFQEPALAVRRFDRQSKGPIHIEDFAQIFAVYPSEKYDVGNYKNIAEVLRSETNENDIPEFIRRLVFNTLIGNADMHLKNWSLIYPNGKTAKLAPAYDFVSTIAYIPDETMALNYVKSKKISEFSLDLLSYFAAKAGLSEKIVLKTAKETVQKFRESWQHEKLNLPLSSKVISAIEKNLKTIPLLKEVL